jgi:Concanavalin A-like lectin/glucanases superfamily
VLQPPASPSGLIAAYSFDEGTGTTANDTSGQGNHGTVSGAQWTDSGRYGKALVFDGVDDWVTVNDAPSLDLSTAMTLEAWVSPTATPTNWSTVVLKEQSGALVYALYAGSPNNRPGAYLFTSVEHGFTGPAALPLNTWSHLAAT